MPKGEIKKNMTKESESVVKDEKRKLGKIKKKKFVRREQSRAFGE